MRKSAPISINRRAIKLFVIGFYGATEQEIQISRLTDGDLH
jgi:hypothetical protein